MKRIILPLLIIIKVIFPIEYTMHSVLKNYYALRIKGDHDFLIQYNRFQMKSEAYMDNLYSVVVVDFINDLVKQKEVFSLREAWIEYFSSWMSLKIGKQQVVWGKVDGYFVNDIVNPLDLSYFLLQEFDDIRMPINIIKFKIYRNNSSLELVIIPEHRSSIIPTKGNWALFPIQFPPSFQNFNIIEEKPKGRFENIGIGGRYSTFLIGTDLSFIYLRKMEYFPLMKANPLDTLITKFFPWFSFYGFSFSKPFGALVFRGEGGYYKSRYFNTINLDSVKRPFYQYCMGFDYELVTDLNINLQYIEEKIVDYDEKITQDEKRSILTLFVSYKLANETIKPSIISLNNLEDKSAMLGLNIELNLVDNFNIIVGGFLFSGKNGSFFGRFDENDNIFMRLKFYF